MGIGTSDGKYFDDEIDYAFSQFQTSSTTTPKDQPSAGEPVYTTGSGSSDSVNQKDIDALVAAAPNFANNPVIDQMEATSRKFKPTSSLAPDILGEGGSDTIAARPADPSVDSFTDRYGEWDIDAIVNRTIKEDKLERGLNRVIKPGTRTWPSGNTLI